MQADNKLFDDFAKVMNGLAGTVAGMGREAEASARTRAREWIGGLDFVSREEFEVAKAMAVAALRAADAHADAVAGVVLARRPRTALALHVGVLPVEVEVLRTAHACTQVAAADGQAALHRIGAFRCRRGGRSGIHEGQHQGADGRDACARKHVTTVARTLYS